MRIGVVLPSLTPEFGGAHVLTESIINACMRATSAPDEPVTLVVVNYKDDAPTPAADGTRVSVEYSDIDTTRRGNAFAIVAESLRARVLTLRQPWSSSHLMNAYGRVLDRKLTKLGIDLVWFPSVAPCPVDTPFVTALYNLAHIEMPWFPELGGGFEWKKRQDYYTEVLGRAAKVISSTNYAQEMVLKHFPVSPSNVSVVPYPVPGDVPRASHLRLTNNPLSAARPRFLYPAQLWPHKNHVVLIEAVAELKRGGFPVDLVLTGSDKGNADYVRRLIRAQDVEDCIDLRGFVSRGELLDLYRSCDALVAPTLIGPDGLPFLEAMAIGCPVIAGTSMGTEEWIGDCGHCVDNFDPSAWAGAMREAAARSPRVERQVVAGLERTEALTVDAYVGSMMALLLDLARSRRLWGRVSGDS